MKKVMSVIITTFVVTCLLLSGKEGIYKVLAYNAGDNCPICGTEMITMESFNLPTCNEPAISITYTCTNPNCGHTEMATINPPPHHYFKSAEESYEANCTASGLNVYYCDNNNYGVTCGHRTTETIPALGHSYTSTVESNPTCTSNGLKRYTCSRCGNTYTEPISATGHNYQSTITKEATCTEDGIKKYTCQLCGNSYTEPIKATGHKYQSSISKKVSCEENGILKYTCQLCGDEYTETVKATGHNYKTVVNKKATCTEEGTKTKTCSNCGKKINEAIKPLGHDYEVTSEKEATCKEDGEVIKKCKNCGDTISETVKHLEHVLGKYEIVKEASCLEEGLKKAVCENCGKEMEEVIPSLGHKYPEDWTIDKEATLLADGIKSKTCENCGEVISETIKHDPTILYIGGSIAAISLGGFAFFKFRKKAAPAVLEETATEPMDWSFGSRVVVTNLSDANKDFFNLLKRRSFLEVKDAKRVELADVAEDAGADLLICEIYDEKEIEELISLKEEKEAELSLLVSDVMYKKHHKKLDKLVEDKVIIAYTKFGVNDYEKLVKLVLPILKPDVKSDESLENIGNVADALGIPGISTLLNIYVSGRDIKSTVEGGELGISEKATIIGDIASILGFEKLESLAGLVDDVDSVKAAINKKAGAYEVKEGISGGSDFVDVVKEIADDIDNK